MRREVKKYKGIGQVETGSVPLSVNYNLTEYVELIPAGTSQEPNATIEGLHSIEGTITPPNDSTLPSRQDLILHINHGRKLNVMVIALDGATGFVRASGGIYA
jgi:hypothetical protein